MGNNLISIFVQFSGLQLHDPCDSGDLVESHLYELITGTRNADFRTPVRGPPIIGKEYLNLFLLVFDLWGNVMSLHNAK